MIVRFLMGGRPPQELDIRAGATVQDALDALRVDPSGLSFTVTQHGQQTPATLRTELGAESLLMAGPKAAAGRR